MKLRHRLALVFALSTSLMLLVARMGVSVTFMHVQSREFDDLLEARARLRAADVAASGRRALDRASNARPRENVDHLVTYGALYRADGSLLWHPSFFTDAPQLRQLDAWKGGKAVLECFDFPVRDDTLRGVVVEIDAPSEPEARYLLVATSRHEIDADARQLRDLGTLVVVASSVLSLLVGWWIGKRMTRGVEAIAEAAHRVTEGELDVRIDERAMRDVEVAGLALALKQMLDRLKALIENERRFASNAAHELRSPLTALRGELELALRRPRTLPEYERSLRDALDDANRLIALSEDLLVFARASMGRAPGASGKRVRVRELVDKAIAASIARSDAHHAMTIELGALEDVEVEGEANELVRVLRNLIDNAVGHAPEGKRVRVNARRGDATATGAPSDVRVHIGVEDDGDGVPLELRERIFEPFVRGDAERERSGAGLGLAIAREIARRYGGEIVLENAVQPTRFVLALKLAPPAGASVAPDDVSPIASRGTSHGRSHGASPGASDAASPGGLD